MAKLVDSIMRRDNNIVNIEGDKTVSAKRLTIRFAPALFVVIPFLAAALVGQAKGEFALSAVFGYGGDKVTICHSTRSATNPWVKITVDAHALDSRQHRLDTFPAKDGSCPGRPIPVNVGRSRF